MQYVEAFRTLGYHLKSQRTDWSAEKEDGICVAIWRKQAAVADRLPYVDLWELHPNGGEFEKKAGHVKRTRHIERAVRDLAGRIDVVFVSGTPGQSYEDADPWLVDKRGGHWRVSKFDSACGYFRAEVFSEPN